MSRFIGTCQAWPDVFQQCVVCSKSNDRDCDGDHCPKFTGKTFKILSVGFTDKGSGIALLYDETDKSIRTISVSHMNDISFYDE